MAETLFHCDDLLWQRFTAICRERNETPGAIWCGFPRPPPPRAGRAGDQAACATIGFSRIGRCTSALNAPTPTPIHQTSV